ncbi:LysR family transcriptional regulator [Aliamphritea spongicola]|uniref:LysR family transcriptional regulator n=1 Tax=Aliamphritea spongicola TaxID=707589 RepID=UPI00196AD524|nr:LysR family transcriptional regulator [Aliamphritea spongicola]MBN3564404.1 LysR family transcriptional regulator [Aliamphritea spongicola]
MDTVLLKTFLEVTHARNFGKASEILCVAPSTVSARIRQLEELLGLSLFIRNHQQVSLTPAGEHMVRHARFILNAWERAYEDIALSANLNKRLVVAGTPSLWDIFLQDWLNEVHSQMPELALRAEDSTTLRVMEKLERGSIDIGFIYEQPKLANLVIEELKSIPLQLVSTQPGLDADRATSSGYIRVEWGSVFNSLHERYFPQRPLAPVRVNSMRIAMKLMLSSGGSAYLPVISTAERVNSGELFVVEDAPRLEMKAYAAYSPHGEHHDLIKQLLAML